MTLKSIAVATALTVGSLGLTVSAQASTIAFFENSTYVDVTTEGANLEAELTGLGHTVSGFTGITAAAISAAVAGADVLVFPEMEINQLVPDLDAAAIATLASYVAGGGHIIQANAFPDNISLPNTLFGFALVQVGSLGVDTALNDPGDATGTVFEGGPATLPNLSAVEGISTASLPAGALSIYGAGGDTSVFTVGIGSGDYTYLGYDWFEGTDPDWAEVLDRAIGITADVPAPAPLALAGLGLMLLMRGRRS